MNDSVLESFASAGCGSNMRSLSFDCECGTESNCEKFFPSTPIVSCFAALGVILLVQLLVLHFPLSILLFLS